MGQRQEGERGKGSPAAARSPTLSALSRLEGQEEGETEASLALQGVLASREGACNI